MESLPGSVYLTGATGLVGSHVAEQLRSEGVRVVALQREVSDTRFLDQIGCEIVVGDVRDAPEALAPGMEGCDAVVHAAALVYAGSTWPAVREVNVEGTRRVVRAAGLAGVSHLVHVSSVAVYGPTLTPDEDDPLEAPLESTNLYGRSKREAERVALEEAETQALALTSARPCVVYGERDRLFVPKIGRAASLPVVPIMGSGHNRVPVVYAGNVARGLLAMLRGRGKGGVFNLSEDEPLTQRGLIEGFARGLGRAPRFAPIPATLVRGVADLTRRIGGSIPGVKGLSLDRVARLGLNHNPYPADRAREVLGWTEHTPHQEALHRTARWWLSTRE